MRSAGLATSISMVALVFSMQAAAQPPAGNGKPPHAASPFIEFPVPRHAVGIIAARMPAHALQPIASRTPAHAAGPGAQPGVVAVTDVPGRGLGRSGAPGAASVRASMPRAARPSAAPAPAGETASGGFPEKGKLPAVPECGAS